MCRVLGCVGNNFSRQNFTLALDHLKRGGPDSSGVYFSKQNKVYFGHTRLAILDTSNNGAQPMVSNENECVIIFNGEIYNYLSLKNTLVSKGYKFKSQTDTEVMLNGYKEWGTKIFTMLEGMFAIAIYDISKNIIVLARDYFGIKPLYYFQNENEFSFASEVKALKILNPAVYKSLDWKIYFLAFGFIPEPQTVLKDVFSLKSGYYLIYNLKTNKISSYPFSRKNYESPSRANKTILDNYFHQLDNSIKSSLIADEKIAVSLSGGFDSGYIAKIASKFNSISSLSLDFSNSDISERKSINHIAHKLKISNHKKLLTKKIFFKNLNNIINAYDQPSVDGINIYFISKFAHRKKFKVLLSGLGSDEMLLGYPNDKYIPYIKYLFNIRIIIFSICKIFPSKNSKLINRLYFIELKKELFHYLFIRGLFNPEQISQILKLPKKYIIKTLNKLIFDTDNTNDYSFHSSIQNHLYLKSQLLNDTDKMSMNFGVEIRVPFLNPMLYKLLIHFFNTNKTSDYLNKKILKDHFSLPIQTKKQGFSLPMDDWVRELKINYQLGPKCHWSKKWALYLLDNYKL